MVTLTNSLVVWGSVKSSVCNLTELPWESRMLGGLHQPLRNMWKFLKELDWVEYPVTLKQGSLLRLRFCGTGKTRCLLCKFKKKKSSCNTLLLIFYKLEAKQALSPSALSPSHPCNASHASWKWRKNSEIPKNWRIANCGTSIFNGPLQPCKTISQHRGH